MLLTRRALLLGAGSLALATPPGLGAYAVGVEPRLPARVTRYRITPPRWPDGVALRIVALSDIHACEPWMSPERVRAIALAANALRPDVIALLGDYNAGHPYVTAPVLPEQWGEALSVLRAPLGVFGVLGNHDWWHGPVPGMPGNTDEVRRGLRLAGARVLENDLVPLDKDGRRIWLAGLADQIAYLQPGVGPRGADDLPGTLRGVTDEAPVVVLMHEPDLFAGMTDRVALALCGHTHGGQVIVPGFGAPFTPSRLFLYGHYQSTRRHMIVSAGLGESGFPARFGMPPEIVVVDLGSAAA